MVSYILRRRKLGKTSAREIARKSTTGILVYRHDANDVGKFHRFNHVTNLYTRENPPSNPEYVFRWGCTSSVPGNPIIVNSVQAIGKVGHKGNFRKLCADEGVAQKTWLPGGEPISLEDYPIVVRPNQHAQGRNLHVCNNPAEALTAMQKYPSNWYASKLIQKVAEYRVFVAQGRVVWVAKKTPGNPNQVAWNVAQGGSFENVNWSQWPLKAVKTSIKAFELSGLDFGGVDVMVDAEGGCYVLEINSAPSQTSPYRQECVAKVFDYIVQNGKAAIPRIDGLGDWKKFIHVALSPEALVP